MNELNFVFVHQFAAALVDHAGQVGDPDVFAWHSQLDQHTQTRQRGSTCARGHQLHLGDVFVNHFQAVQNRCAHHNGGAVLVVMKDGNLHALAQFALDVKAVGRLDVFQVDATKSGLKRGNDVDQFVGVFFVHLNVKHIDASKLFEQHALAFHDWLGREWTDVTQAQHRCAVGDDGDQIASAGVFIGVVGVFDDFLARCGHTGGVGQRQIVLVEQLLGGLDGNLAGAGELVVFKCCSA